MVKKIIIIVSFCVFLLVIYGYTLKDNKQTPNSQKEDNQITSFSVSPSKTPTKPPTQVGGSSDYQVNYLIVRPTDIIELYSNLDEMFTSSEIRSKYSCLSLVSGGFYTEEQKHIGLFYAQEKLKSNPTQNPLFDGFFTIDTNKKPLISASPPLDFSGLRIAIQAGPILYQSGKPKSLASTTGEFARRVMVGISNRGEITFIALSTKNNPVSGPKLRELPEIIKNLNTSTSLNITDALNLDGGAHSVFITDSANLGELSTIGSFFCIKPGN